MASAERTNTDSSERKGGWIHLPDGTLYTGRMKDGVPEGEGIVKFFWGNAFRGNFHNGKPDGVGKVRLTTGDVIEGEFVNGVFKGYKKTFLKWKVFEAHVEDGTLIFGTTEEIIPEAIIRELENSESAAVEDDVLELEEPTEEEETYHPVFSDEEQTEETESEKTYSPSFSEEQKEPQIIEEAPVAPIVTETAPATPAEEPLSPTNEGNPIVITRTIYVQVPVSTPQPAQASESGYKPHYPGRRTIFSEGTKEYPDGIYTGGFRNGKRHGKGKFVSNSGMILEGDFSMDRPHGFIKKFDPEHNIKFEGLYRNGEMFKGKFEMNGMVYVGEFKRGVFHGDGRFIGSDGKVLEGLFRWGKYMGPHVINEKQARKALDNEEITSEE